MHPPINREQLEELKRQTAIPIKQTLETLQPESIFASSDDLKTRALQASSKALDVLIEAASNEMIPIAQKMKAAEIILEIAYGKDKSGLRAEDTSENALTTIQKLIEQSQYPTLNYGTDPSPDPTP